MISVGATYNWSTFSCTESYPIGDLTVDKVIILDTTGPGFYQADHTQHINGDNKNAYLQYMHSLQHCPTQQIWQIIYQVIKGKLVSNLWSPQTSKSTYISAGHIWPITVEKLCALEGWFYDQFKADILNFKLVI